MRKKLMAPNSPAELLEALFTIFPEYRASCPEPSGDEPSYHSILTDFSCVFGRLAASASEKQLRAFAQLVNAAVEGGGVLENAFGTCLLEHLHQIRALRMFRPYLSDLAREKTKA